MHLPNMYDFLAVEDFLGSFSHRRAWVERDGRKPWQLVKPAFSRKTGKCVRLDTRPVPDDLSNILNLLFSRISEEVYLRIERNFGGKYGLKIMDSEVGADTLEEAIESLHDLYLTYEDHWYVLGRAGKALREYEQEQRLGQVINPWNGKVVMRAAIMMLRNAHPDRAEAEALDQAEAVFGLSKR